MRRAEVGERGGGLCCFWACQYALQAVRNTETAQRGSTKRGRKSRYLWITHYTRALNFTLPFSFAFLASPHIMRLAIITVLVSFFLSLVLSNTTSQYENSFSLLPFLLSNAINLWECWIHDKKRGQNNYNTLIC